MTTSLRPGFRIASAAIVAAPIALYMLFIGLSMNPYFQRHFLYAHKVNDLWRTDLDKPETWGFATNQVTPFSLRTSDEETIYAWHILPLPLYLQNEATVSAQESGFSKDFTTTESFRLLKDDDDAKLIIYFHGNAGHIAQAHRPKTYHGLTATSSYHVLSFDYRGFGHSTGAPTEAGILDDATAVVSWAIDTAGIPPNRIVLLGQSLGTAVVSGVAERLASKGVEFAGLVLVAGFSNLTTMLSEYRMGGLVPVLGPLKRWPAVLGFVHSFIVDKWNTAERLASIVRQTKTRLRLSLIHAKNDRDIPWTEDNKMFRAAVNETVGIIDDKAFEAWKDEHTIRKSEDAFVTTWESKPNVVVRQELFPHGGHNNIMGFSPVIMAVMRSFDLDGTGYA